VPAALACAVSRLAWFIAYFPITFTLLPLHITNAGQNIGKPGKWFKPGLTTQSIIINRVIFSLGLAFESNTRPRQILAEPDK
jgi:hypothetical protein